MIWYDLPWYRIARYEYVFWHRSEHGARYASDSFSASRAAPHTQDEIPEDDAAKQESERPQKSATHFRCLPFTPVSSISEISKQVWPVVGHCFVRSEQLAWWTNSGAQEADKVRVCNLSDVPHHTSTALGATGIGIRAPVIFLDSSSSLGSGLGSQVPRSTRVQTSAAEKKPWRELTCAPSDLRQHRLSLKKEAVRSHVWPRVAQRYLSVQFRFHAQHEDLALRGEHGNAHDDSLRSEASWLSSLQA